MLDRKRRPLHVDQRVALAVRESLVGTLFASPSTLAAGALTGSIVSAVIGWSSHDPLLVRLCSLISLIGAVRVASAMAYRDTSRDKRSARTWGWERFYEFGAWTFAGLLGLMTYLTITREQAALHLLAAATTTGYAAAISGRNAARPRVAMGQLSLAALPLTAALAFQGGLIRETAAFVNIVFLLAMLEISRQTHRVVLGATTAAHEQTLLAQRFERLAQIDSLTGLHNRFALKTSLERHLNAPGGEPAALLWVDLDRFKEVNDTLGHPVGDQLLCVVAERLQSVAGEQDCLARFGGDEFVLLTVGTDRHAAQTLAERILGLLSKPIRVDGASLHVSASIGIATVTYGERDAEALLKYADMALYHAKTSGRSSYREFEPAMQQRLLELRDMEESLRVAIDRNELEVYYQPIISLRSSQVTSCEALVRWHHPARGMISPAEFVPLAERTGQIEAITTWVLAEACRTAISWPAEIRVAVNISPIMLKRTDLMQAVLSALIDSGLAAERLELEITETVFLDDSGQSTNMLKSLQRIGVKLALDDFGTGYSSLSYLHKYYFDKIKIDRSFIGNIETNRTTRGIVNAIVSLARTLEIDTVAEGVETASQLRQVREIGCQAAQGFYLSFPVPATELGTILARRDIVPVDLAPMLRLTRGSS